ncbi:ABC transporter ATP-binding protein [Desulfurococcaceae archaeon MEX13E-LK6-19]|nr:ABC transporter ATP-binding protein [Desulfurococcaceae archaeon MEX13E-LK6-19]
MIILKNIIKKYGVIKALDNINLEIPQGKITVILGPSGAGKTTLLRIIAGLEEPDQGRIIIDGKDVTLEPPWRRGVSMVFQQPALLPHLTAYENIAFGLEALEIPREEIEKRVLWAARLTRIESLLDKYPDQLSGGEQQRVALARALVTRPRILLLDEPLSNLDLALREELRLELRRIQKETGITFIHVTHDQDEALELADYLVVLVKGKIVEHGEPMRVYENTRSIEAAKLFNHNIVETRIIDKKKVYPWDHEWTRARATGVKEIIPQHKLDVKPADKETPCVVKEVLYRRNYGVALIECNNSLIRVALPLNKAKKIRKSINVEIEYVE